MPPEFFMHQAACLTEEGLPMRVRAYNCPSRVMSPLNMILISSSL